MLRIGLHMKKRLSLLARGLFPETLPPCFTSIDAARAFHGIVSDLDQAKFRKRPTHYVRYNGTKHDRNRRFFATPNIVSYFHVSTFIHRYWKDFNARYQASPYSLSAPTVLDESADRAIKVASLSELSAKSSKQLAYAPVVLKTDISQFYASIYTHSIAWSRHGREASKADMSERSKEVYFNELDFHVRNCQMAQTRGLLIGPDAFRLIAEFISCGIDSELKAAAGKAVIGAVRHVDDYYIGLRSEAEGLVVLSQLREILAGYELQLNDAKTRIYPSLQPINDVWAQKIRDAIHLASESSRRRERLELLLDEAFQLSANISSDSPVKMVLRGLDGMRIYASNNWEFVESYLQRCMHYHPHAIDYVCLLVVKRFSLGEPIDKNGWQAVSEYLMSQHLPYRDHHELVWLFWMSVACDLEIKDEMVDRLLRVENAHMSSLIVQAFVEGKIGKRPAVRFQNRLATTDSNWLLNIVARSSGFTRASFGGDMSTEFEHLASRKVRLVNIGDSTKSFESKTAAAISRTRYGYDDDDEDFDDDEDAFGDWGDLGL